MFSNISCGDLIRFSGCYVILTSEGPRIMMDSIHRDGVVVELSEDVNTIRVFSQNQICILSSPDHQERSLEYRILNETEENV